MPIATDNKGNQLLEVIQGNEDELIANETHRPLPLSLVIVKCAEGFMLLKNKYRNVWELPGGCIEPNETPKECAVRECLEESGYAISNPRFAGMIKFFLLPDFFRAESRIEYATLYCADVQQTIAFQENEEISALCWHNIGDQMEDANPMDVKLLEYFI